MSERNIIVLLRYHDTLFSQSVADAQFVEDVWIASGYIRDDQPCLAHRKPNIFDNLPIAKNFTSVKGGESSVRHCRLNPCLVCLEELIAKRHQDEAKGTIHLEISPAPDWVCRNISV